MKKKRGNKEKSKNTAKIVLNSTSETEWAIGVGIMVRQFPT